MAQHVIVTDYDPQWREKYLREEENIKEILGENSIAVYHIGSTSVQGLAAKPIIDIMPVVRSLEEADRVSGAFEKAGYEYLGEFGIAGGAICEREGRSGRIRSTFSRRTIPRILNATSLSATI